MSAVSEILDRLDGVRQRGADSWIAKCPHHKDRSPSLTIKDVGDGRILLHCFAGCPPINVLGSIGLSFESLFPERLPEQSYQPVPVPFNAHDTLKMMSEETDRVLLAALDMQKGKTLSAVDVQRLGQAAIRIRNAHQLINRGK